MKSQKHKPNFFLFLTTLALMAFVFPSSLMIKSNSPIDLDQKFVFQHPYPSLASSLINESDLAALHLSARFNEIDIKIVATGKTSGHIADAHIQNNLRKNVTVKIPTGEIPKDIINPREARQGFFVTEPLDFEIPGKTSIILPIRGYCNNPTLDSPV